MPHPFNGGLDRSLRVHNRNRGEGDVLVHAGMEGDRGGVRLLSPRPPSAQPRREAKQNTKETVTAKKLGEGDVSRGGPDEHPKNETESHLKIEDPGTNGVNGL